MQVQDTAHTGREPSLRSLGIRVQSNIETETAGTADIDQAERLTLVGLQLQQFEQAYLVRPGTTAQPLVIDPSQFDADRLIGSLQRIGRQVDLDTALELHGAASSLIAGIRQLEGLSGEAAEDPDLTLVLAGPFGEIQLNLARLDPAALRTAFSSGLQEQANSELQAVHSQLGPLSQQVRAGFGPEDDPQIDSWMAASKAVEFKPEAFFEKTLGYHPLHEESGVRHLLSMLSQSRDLPDLNPEMLANRAEGMLLADKARALIEAANQLEAELELAPAPDSPDVLDLLKAFLAIIRQVDQDINALLKQQSKLKQFERKLLSQFAERLHRNLRLYGEKLELLQDSGQERLKLLTDQRMNEVRAKFWLASQGNASQELRLAMASLSSSSPL
ncbi:MAG: hypothetical protein CVV27_00270 [Candidatus Melainabacteria bacterium HGW-Melainabacteria-1]|nr:MAG: hypothetical protein CVV27_00270 [Candidatus Melainabacteria bacterium HGW-Melainabacteria-1]